MTPRQFLTWWLWQRWHIYCPRYLPTIDSRKYRVARLNCKSWPCSDKQLWFPAIELNEEA